MRLFVCLIITVSVLAGTIILVGTMWKVNDSQSPRGQRLRQLVTESHVQIEDGRRDMLSHHPPPPPPPPPPPLPGPMLPVEKTGDENVQHQEVRERRGEEGGTDKVKALEKKVMALEEKLAQAERQKDSPKIVGNESADGEDSTLTICIPTHPRAGQTDFLHVVLGSVADEVLPARQLGLDVRVIIFDGAASHVPARRNPAFEGAKMAFGKTYDWMTFEKNVNSFADPKHGWEPNSNLHGNTMPGTQVRKQNWDFVHMLRRCSSHSKYIMIWEDDFVLCPRALSQIMSALVVAKSSHCRSQVRTWNILKVSIGMNGVIMPHEFALDYAEYLFDNLSVKPCDLLIWDNFLNYRSLKASGSIGPGLRSIKSLPYDPHLLFKFHLGHHIGRVSTFDFRNERKFKKKFDQARNANRCFKINPSWNVKAKGTYHGKMIGNLWEDVARCDPSLSEQHVKQYMRWANVKEV